jgi:hypothetical protein
MVQENIDLIVNVEGLNTLQKFSGTLSQLTNKAKLLTKQSQAMNRQFDFFNDTLRKANRAGVSRLFGDMSAQTKTFSERLQRLTGPFLSLLFFGMQLQRTFTGALKSIFEGYKKAIPESAKFNQETNRLSANWEFFKFQLADALAQSPLFTQFIGFLIEMLKKLQALSPETKKWLTVTLALGAAFGLSLFVIGQIGLAIPGLILLAEGFAAAWGFVTAAIGLTQGAVLALFDTTTVFGAEIAALAAPWLGVIALIGLLGFAWVKFVDKFKDGVGLITDDWTDYIVIFVGAFVNGVAQIGLTILQLQTLWLDFFANTLKAGIKFAKFLGDAIAAALDPTKTVKDEFDEFFDDIKDLFGNPKNYGLTSGLQALKDEISLATLDLTKEFTNPAEPTQNVQNNYTVVTLDEAIASGALTAEGAEALRNLGVTGF